MMIGVVILTLNAEKRISSILDKIDTDKYSILVIDSDSNDLTVDIVKRYKCNIKVIDRISFNHGTTREFARKNLKTDIVVYLTDDAIPASKNFIQELVQPLLSGKASVSYAKQIPRKGADILESFPREFNYNNEYQLRSLKDIDKYGVHTFFCSNSCAAYLNKDLDEIGGFKPTLTNEDYFAVAELLINNKKVSYTPKAKVYHSHKYTIKEEFQRYFDTGYVRAERKWIKKYVGNAEKKGAEYTKLFLKTILFNRPLLLPYAFFQIISKYLGYKIGYNALSFPDWIKIKLSGQKLYWKSKHYLD